MLKCERCENVDDLAVVEGQVYCLPCRTCPHGRVYLESWTRACSTCVRDLHTVATFDGPRIRDVTAYVDDVLAWGLDVADVEAWTFIEMEEVPFGPKARTARRDPTRHGPPHFLLGSRGAR